MTSLKHYFLKLIFILSEVLMLRVIYVKNDIDTLKEMYEGGEHSYTNIQIIEQFDLIYHLFPDDYIKQLIKVIYLG